MDNTAANVVDHVEPHKGDKPHLVFKNCDGPPMPVTRRIYVSLPADHWLSKEMNDLKWAIVDEIENLGFTPEVFTNPKGKPGLASSRAWGARDADEVARRCVGTAIIGMARWNFHDDDGRQARLPTEFNHYEGALARTLGLPTLVLVQQDVMRRVVFDPTFGGFVGEIPPKADPGWLKTEEFRVPFGYWRMQLYQRRDVFLGYCSSSRATAAALKHFLQSAGATVLDCKPTLLQVVLSWFRSKKPRRAAMREYSFLPRTMTSSTKGNPTSLRHAITWCLRPAISLG